ncbi:aldehyde dehydrogenase EutE [bacterium]|nr:aldehyde dehydrogenase EutE [bacterium]
MKITDDQINSIVDRVVNKLLPNQQESVSVIKKTTSAPITTHTGLLGVFSSIDEAVDASERAYETFKTVSVSKRKDIISAIRKICLANLETLARMGHQETGMGRYDDKIAKNRLAIEKTPGVEDLETMSLTGDEGMTFFERAPFGIIGSITPSTNPTETIISNGIAMLAGGNSVVFNTHPSAKNCSIFTIDLLNKAVLSQGGPANMFTTVATPTIQSANRMMTHPKINLLVVTGGPGVVEAAMKSGKRVIAAGPGNPPVVVDETADIEQAAKDIVTSAGTDNNIICIIEKEIIVLEAVADRLKKALIKYGAVEISPYQGKQLEKIILKGNHPNRDYVGKDIQYILKDIGINHVDPSKRIAIIETGPEHPFAIHELLMPVIPFIRVKDIDTAIDVAYKLEGGCFHTAVIHSKNVDRITKMGKKMNVSIFVANGPALAGLGLGGEGPASFTIASPTGEGVTTPRHFTRIRKTVVHNGLRVV